MEEHQRPRPFAGRRLLVVEDEAVVAVLVEEMLTEMGCAVVGVAGSLSQGLELLADEAIPDRRRRAGCQSRWRDGVSAGGAAAGAPHPLHLRDRLWPEKASSPTSRRPSRCPSRSGPGRSKTP